MILQKFCQKVTHKSTKSYFLIYYYLSHPTSSYFTTMTVLHQIVNKCLMHNPCLAACPAIFWPNRLSERHGYSVRSGRCSWRSLVDATQFILWGLLPGGCLKQKVAAIRQAWLHSRASCGSCRCQCCQSTWGHLRRRSKRFHRHHDCQWLRKQRIHKCAKWFYSSLKYLPRPFGVPKSTVSTRLTSHLSKRTSPMGFWCAAVWYRRPIGGRLGRSMRVSSSSPSSEIVQ